MNPQYKLVVVTPFNDYKRGDAIIDQAIVSAILDVTHEMHVYDANVRRVALNAEEITHLSSLQGQASTPEVLNLSSITECVEPAPKPQNIEDAEEQ